MPFTPPSTRESFGVRPTGHHLLVFDDDDPRRTVYAMRLQGWSIDRIAQQMGASEATVDRWADEADRIVREYMATNQDTLLVRAKAAQPRYTPDQRRADAAALLDETSGWGATLTVAASGEEGWSYSITFNDLAAASFSDLVAATVESLEADSGVVEVLREDRELILVKTSSVDQMPSSLD